MKKRYAYGKLAFPVMSNFPEYLERGERARLFPVLADTSKEGRSTAILLSCLVHVREFGQSMLASVNQKVGKRANLKAYTEVVFKGKTHRPDGLLVLRVGKREWRGLIETKIGNAKLSEEQIADYIDLAKKYNINALITISNQFTSRPDHHPIKLSTKTRSRVEIYHWSWMYIITQADLLISNQSIEDEDQHFILTEMVRFLTHSSTGVKSFDRMPSAWTEVVQKVADGAPLQQKNEEIQDVVAAWHQEVRDISLMLSRQVNVKVEIKLSRSQLDPVTRAKEDTANLVKNHTLTARLDVHNAAASIDVVVDIKRRTISASMMLIAPDNRKTTASRLSWLLQQLQKSSETDIHIKLHWPGRKAHTQHALGELRENSKIAWENSKDRHVLRFEVCMIRQLTKRFGQRKNFIDELENLVSGFYETVGQRLRAYQSPAPRVREDRVDPESVTPKGLQRTVKGEKSEHM